MTELNNLVSMTNKGTGAGGSRTNLFGKMFENETDIVKKIVSKGFIRQGDGIYTKKFKDRVITFANQSKFKAFMKKKFNIEEVFRLPDEACIIEYNNGIKMVKILEKKEQRVEGSVETKLWSCPSLKEEYEILIGSQFQISYGLCVNSFLKKRLTSGLKKYEILNIILKRHNIDVFFGDDDDYYSRLYSWFCIEDEADMGEQEESKPPCQMVCLNKRDKKEMTEQLICEEYIKSTGIRCTYKMKITRDDGKRVCLKHGKKPKCESKGEAKGESKGEAKGESKGEAKGESKGEAKGESKGEAKGESKGEAKGESKSESKGESKSEPKSESKGESNSTVEPRPILKWVGGKSQILNKLLPQFPTEINNYYEIFVGGGSVLLSLLSRIRDGTITLGGSIYAFDSNEALIYMYKNIQSNHQELYQTIENFVNTYISKSSTEQKEEYYYSCRNQYNKLEDKKSILASALFIFLNKTCFRGLYREGRNGFNVPFGNYLNPEVINKSHLDEIHSLIQPVIFDCQDFESSMTMITNENDFVYLDPPYAPETSTSFVSYNNTGFSLEKHKKLFELIRSLPCKFVLSNSDVELVRENFTGEQYIVETVLCKRAINSKNPSAKTNEVIIKN